MKNYSNSIIVSLVLLFLQILPATAESYNTIEIIDKENQLDEKIEFEILNELENLKNQIKDLNTFIVFTPEPTANIYKTSLEKWRISNLHDKALILFINQKQKQSKIIYWNQESIINEETINHINRQYLTENLKEFNALPLKKAIYITIQEFHNQYLIAKVSAQKKTSTAQQNDTYTPQFFLIFYALIIITIPYLFQSLIKYQHIGKLYEKREFSTFGRINDKNKTLYIVGIVICSIIFLYQFLFYYDEVMVASIMVIAASTPLTHAILFIAFLGGDTWKLFHKSKDQTNSGLNIVSQYLLIHPMVSTSKLMEITFYDLIVKQQLLIVYEWKQFRDGRSKKYTRIEKGPQFDPTLANPYELPFLVPLESLKPEYGYYDFHYIKLVLEQINGLKYFRKDLVSIELLKNDLISGPHWLINIFKLTVKGEKLKSRLLSNCKILDEKFTLSNQNINETISLLSSNQDKLLLVENINALTQGNLSEEMKSEILTSDLPLLKHFIDENFDPFDFEKSIDNYFKQKSYKYEHDNEYDIWDY